MTPLITKYDYYEEVLTIYNHSDLEIKNAFNGSDISLEFLALIKFSWIAVNEETFAFFLLQHRFLQQRQHCVLQQERRPVLQSH